MNGGPARDCPLLWSIHHWDRLGERGLEINVQQGIVEDKIAGAACVLGRFKGTLLTFPVTGV